MQALFLQSRNISYILLLFIVVDIKLEDAALSAFIISSEFINSSTSLSFLNLP